MSKSTKFAVGVAIGALIAAITSFFFTSTPSFRVLATLAGAAVGGWIFNDIMTIISKVPEAFSVMINAFGNCGRWSKKQMSTPTILSAIIIPSFIVFAIMTLILIVFSPIAPTDPINQTSADIFLAIILGLITMLTIAAAYIDDATNKLPDTWAELRSYLPAKSKKAAKAIGTFLKKNFLKILFWTFLGIPWCLWKLFILCHTHERLLSAIDAVIVATIWLRFIKNDTLMFTTETIISVGLIATIGFAIGKAHYCIKETLVKLVKPQLT